MGTVTGYPDFQTFAQATASILASGTYTVVSAGTTIPLGAVNSFAALTISVANTGANGLLLQVEVAEDAAFATAIVTKAISLRDNDHCNIKVPVELVYARLVLVATGPGNTTATVTVTTTREGPWQVQSFGSERVLYQSGAVVAAGGNVLDEFPQVTSNNVNFQISNEAGSGSLQAFVYFWDENNNLVGVPSESTFTTPTRLQVPGNLIPIAFQIFNTSAVSATIRYTVWESLIV